MKIRPVGTELLHAHGRTDRWTDMAKLIVAFRNFANVPKKMVMNFQKGTCLEIKTFTCLKSEKPKTTEMRCWTPIELSVINLLWTPIATECHKLTVDTNRTECHKLTVDTNRN